MDSVRFYVQKIFSKLPVIAFDVLSIPTAWYMAYWLRFNLHPFSTRHELPYSFRALAILAVLQTGFYYYFKVYRGLWRFASLNDVARILRAVGCATVFVLPLFYLTEILFYIPRAVTPLYAMILATLWCSARLLVRHYSNRHVKCEEAGEVVRVIIVGAGQAAEGLIRDLKRSSVYLPIGIVDDSHSKRGLEVHGVRVLGTIPSLSDWVRKHRVDMIFIAIPSAGSHAMRRIVDYCEACAIPFHTLPSLHALATGQVEINALRKVNIDDLLGRDAVHLNWDKIAAVIHGMRVLVTGGGGSIGSELCRQIMALQPAKLMVVDSCEYNLYSIDQALRAQHPKAMIQRALISVTDAVAVDEVFGRFKPDIVFHAAAYKHVPLLEDQIRIAVQNNVLGTQIVAQASVVAGVDKFILISTDKAVNPTNIMGTTKRVAEIYCQNLNARVNTQFITVRFGNVLGSMGSVVPLFQQQLQQGGPLTVTHPDIERYFMTIPEA
ncbi:MAG TPA: polysaccharide biosynthesis protein, partial [Legionella sp.]|nr:polysaccharide biosynthesis protein [Legionella sp.]